MNVSGIFNISKKTKNGKVYYYTSISKKNQDGSNESMLLPVRFTKGNETMLIMFPDDQDGNVWYNVDKAWLSFYTSMKGEKKPILIISQMILATDYQVNYILNGGKK